MPEQELVDSTQVGVALAILSGAGLVVALMGLALRRRPVVVAGGATAILFPLWLGYNAIVDALGLDSVAALLINIVLFVAVGVAGGLFLRRLGTNARGSDPAPGVERPG